MPDYSRHRQQIGRAGGLVSRARQTNEEHRKTRAAEGRMRRFLTQVPDHITDEVERWQCALRLQQAHMQLIAMKSAAARRKPKRSAA